MNLLTFTYLNHNGEQHRYKVIPLSTQFGLCKCFPDDPFREAWTLTCVVLERSGEKRHVMRTFAIVKMRDVSEEEIKG